MKNNVFIALFFLGCCFLGGLIGYFVYQYSHTDVFFSSSQITEEKASTSPNQVFSSPQFLDTLDVSPKKESDEAQTKNIQNPQKKDSLETNIQKPIPKIIPSNISKIKKPKLAIIMDDLAYPTQLHSLRELNLKITPSFFPRNVDNPKTPQMAENEEFYMIHLPLEALHFHQSPHRYIKVGESIESISEYIGEIKHDFPKLKFLNNHTGSKFTASYEDMKNLIEILQSYDIEFIDSRTTKETKAPEIYAQINKPLLSRQIFLDNTESIFDILKQIEKAIAIAKKDGFAIAIAHPRASTFKALKRAKKNLFNEVELVFIKDIKILEIQNKHEKKGKIYEK